MEDNESLHITIKKPPDPKPVRSLGIFDSPDNPNITQLVQQLIRPIEYEPSKEFTDNVKDEVLKLLSQKKIVAVSVKGKITSVHFQ